MPTQKDDEEDIIIPEFKPLLGEGDAAVQSTNATKEEAFRFLREALDSDSANRSKLVELTGLPSTAE